MDEGHDVGGVPQLYKSPPVGVRHVHVDGCHPGLQLSPLDRGECLEAETQPYVGPKYGGRCINHAFPMHVLYTTACCQSLSLKLQLRTDLRFMGKKNVGKISSSIRCKMSLRNTSVPDAPEHKNIEVDREL